MAYFSKRKEVISSTTFVIKSWGKLRDKMIWEPIIAAF